MKTMFKRIEKQNAAYCLLVTERSKQTWLREKLDDQIRAQEDEYGRGLKISIQKRLKSHEHSYRLRVRPMVDHSKTPKIAAPFVTVNWAGRGGRFDFETICYGPQDVTDLVKRINATIKLNTL